MTEYPIRFLEPSLTGAILVALYEHEGEITKTILTSMVTNGRGETGSKYNTLEEMGLIEIKKTRRLNAGHWVSLTDKGKRIAALLVEIQNILIE